MYKFYIITNNLDSSVTYVLNNKQADTGEEVSSNKIERGNQILL